MVFMSPCHSSHPWPLLALLLLACLVGVSACSSTPQPSGHSGWAEELNEILRLPPAEADDALKDLASRAPSTYQARNIEFERARLARRHGDYERAQQLFGALWDSDPDDSAASRARYELARIAWDVDGDPDGARGLLEETIVHTAPWAGADFALSFLLRKERGLQRHNELADTLLHLAEQSSDDPMRAKLYLERGQTLHDPLRRPNDALADFRRAFDACYDCSAADEALFQMGQIYEAHQRWQPAIAVYEILANRSDTASFVGTYASHRASKSRYRLGVIHLLFLSDYDAASDHFHAYIDRFDNHRYTDDSAWHLVQIERLRGNDDAFQRALERFVEHYPYSPYLDDARHQLAEAR